MLPIDTVPKTYDVCYNAYFINHYLCQSIEAMTV